MKSLKISKAANQRTNNGHKKGQTMAIKKGQTMAIKKGQTMIYKTLHRKLKIDEPQ